MFHILFFCTKHARHKTTLYECTEPAISDLLLQLAPVFWVQFLMKLCPSASQRPRCWKNNYVCTAGAGFSCTCVYLVNSQTSWSQLFLLSSQQMLHHGWWIIAICIVCVVFSQMKLHHGCWLIADCTTSVWYSANWSCTMDVACWLNVADCATSLWYPAKWSCTMGVGS